MLWKWLRHTEMWCVGDRQDRTARLNSLFSQFRLICMSISVSNNDVNKWLRFSFRWHVPETSSVVNATGNSRCWWPFSPSCARHWRRQPHMKATVWGEYFIIRKRWHAVCGFKSIARSMGWWLVEQITNQRQTENYSDYHTRGQMSILKILMDVPMSPFFLFRVPDGMFTVRKGQYTLPLEWGGLVCMNGVWTQQLDSHSDCSFLLSLWKD